MSRWLAPDSKGGLPSSTPPVAISVLILSLIHISANQRQRPIDDQIAVEHAAGYFDGVTRLRRGNRLGQLFGRHARHIVGPRHPRHAN